MKKVLTTLLIASLLVLPLGSVALAEDHTEASQPPVTEFIPGAVPAQTTFAQAMSPAIHAALLAMMNRDVSSFSPADDPLAWEALYNMLSLYGQLDDRAEYDNDRLVLPSETAQDFAAALLGSMPAGPIPEELADRLVYDAETDCYLVSCGSDALCELRFDADQGSEVSGALVYLVDGSNLISFRATLAAQDNLFGCALAALELV